MAPLHIDLGICAVPPETGVQQVYPNPILCNEDGREIAETRDRQAGAKSSADA
jgi:hypothetical protein